MKKTTEEIRKKGKAKRGKENGIMKNLGKCENKGTNAFQLIKTIKQYSLKLKKDQSRKKER